MALSFEKIKKDFARHQKRAAILGVLVLVMVGFIIKAYFEMSPKLILADAPPAPANIEVVSRVVDTDARIRQSKELWKILRENHGVAPSLAFSFVPGYYNRDPSRPMHDIQHDNVKFAPPLPAAPVTSQQLERDARVADVKKQALKLTVMSTIVGAGNSNPVAVVNQRILSVGDSIEGFEIIAIKAREVVFKMDGVTLAVKMASAARVPAEESHGQ
jgi:hypothetical protein